MNDDDNGLSTYVIKNDPEGERYLAAIYGGRAITASLAAKVEAIREDVAATDPYIKVGAEVEYNPRLGQLRAVTDAKEIITYVIPCPPDGYWSREGFRLRGIGAYKAVMLVAAEAMFAWPIYRTGLGFGDRERALLLTALENARESLEYAIDNDHYAHDDDGVELRASLLAGWAELEARLS